MRINIKEAAQILSIGEDELLMESQRNESLTAHYVSDQDMKYREDGTVYFLDGMDEDPTWEFELDNLLEYKKILDEERKTKLQEDVRAATEELRLKVGVEE